MIQIAPPRMAIAATTRTITLTPPVAVTPLVALALPVELIAGAAAADAAGAAAGGADGAAAMGV